MRCGIDYDKIEKLIRQSREFPGERIFVEDFGWHKDTFYICTHLSNYTYLYASDDSLKSLITVYIEPDSNDDIIDAIKNLFVEVMVDYINNKATSKVDYEQKYWDCQRQIDEYERERKELQERIDILDNKLTDKAHSYRKLYEDKKKAEQHIKELKKKISELESKNKRLDERNTYITHQFGYLRKEYRSLNDRVECALGHANSALDITKWYDPSWTLVEDRLKIIQCILSPDTPNEKKSCEGCEYEDYPRTFGKRCSCCDDYAFYTPKKD